MVRKKKGGGRSLPSSLKKVGAVGGFSVFHIRVSFLGVGNGASALFLSSEMMHFLMVETQLKLQKLSESNEKAISMGTEMEEGIKPSVWLPGQHAMEEDEVLQYDTTAYDCMTHLSLEWPSLSFDIVADPIALGNEVRREFPHSMGIVAGTQASSAKQNYLALMRITNLTQGQHGQAAKKDDSEDDDMLTDSEDGDEEDAVLHVRKIAHTGGINRIRAMHQNSCIVASWAETAQVQIWDLSDMYRELLDEGDAEVEISKELHRLNALQVHTHSAEGYAVDWSPCHAGRLASGDCRSRIHLWEPSNGGKWSVGAGIKEHEGSVEDIQWSPGEPTVFASASVDRTIRIWDTRDTVCFFDLFLPRRAIIVQGVLSIPILSYRMVVFSIFQ